MPKQRLIVCSSQGQFSDLDCVTRLQLVSHDVPKSIPITRKVSSSLLSEPILIPELGIQLNVSFI